MKNATLSLLLLGIFGAGFLAGAWSNSRERVSAAGLRARKVLYYVDPMHPAYKSDQPGIAPDCGMQLVPVYAEDGHNGSAARRLANGFAAIEPGALSISPERQQLIGVRVSPVEKRSSTGRLRLYGRVAPDETRLYTINAGISGFIRTISNVTTGSQVRRNELLATLSAPEARSLIQAYLVTLDVLERTKKSGDGQAAIDLASAGVQQTTDRLLTLGMSTAQIEDIGRTRQVPSTINVTAPADGFVLARRVSMGEKFDRGDELYRIADLRRVWILADVSGRDAEYVRAGMPAEISLPGHTHTLRAKVSRDVLPQFDQPSQSLKVRLEADNPEYLVRPDMFVDVELPLALPVAIAVPVDAVLDSGLMKTVFVERSPGVFEPRQVETGWRFNDRIEIVKGLVGGERIAVSGAFLLDSETRIRRTQPDTGSPR